MKQEKNRGTESHTVVFDTYTDDSIVVSELFKTDGAGNISIISDFSSEKFFPFFPPGNLIGRPHDDGPKT